MLQTTTRYKNPRFSQGNPSLSHGILRRRGAAYWFIFSRGRAGRSALSSVPLTRPEGGCCGLSTRKASGAGEVVPTINGTLS